MQRRTRRMLWGLGITVTVGLVAWVAGSLWVSRGVNEPPYSVVATEGDVERRRYAPMVVAATIVEGEREDALNEGFRRLAGYIFGGNEKRSKIAMTAPVSASPSDAPESEKIGMTAPVAASALGPGRYRVTFVMPAGRTVDDLPKPNDERVTLEVEQAREVAVIQFRGWATESAIERHTKELLAWADVRGVERGAPILAQYDPPFAMPLMRRNEIQIELRDDAPASAADPVR